MSAVTPQVAHVAHFAHRHPTKDTTPATPTNTYTIASTIGQEPRSIFTRFQSEPISIPTPTRPQFNAPTTTKTFVTKDTAHILQPQFDLNIIFNFF